MNFFTVILSMNEQ